MYVHEVLQLMATFTNDNRFEEYQNLYVKGEEMSMCKVLDEAEARGKFNAVYNFIKLGLVTLEQAAKSIGLTKEQLLDRFKEYKLAL